MRRQNPLAFSLPLTEEQHPLQIASAKFPLGPLVSAEHVFMNKSSSPGCTSAPRSVTVPAKLCHQSARVSKIGAGLRCGRVKCPSLCYMQRSSSPASVF